MMWIPTLHDIVIDGIRAPGIPNQECIMLRAVTSSNLALVGVLLGLKDGAETWPYRNFVYWFGNKVVSEGTTLNLFTGRGQDSSHPVGNGAWNINLFWGQESTLFNNPDVVPMAFRIGQAAQGPMVIRPWYGAALPSPSL
ncbi:hypothetical protein [Xanthomonas axonopodis]|uniref:hypothetical protein n=1 Tax=Xanthomonas axonopodis TaxID=53413 RepID=UPI003557975A